MIRIEVAPARGEWNVRVDMGVQGYDEVFRLKWFAVHYARRKARELGRPDNPVSLRIKKKNGRYQEERTYPRSADPRRTPG